MKLCVRGWRPAGITFPLMWRAKSPHQVVVWGRAPLSLEPRGPVQVNVLVHTLITSFRLAARLYPRCPPTSLVDTSFQPHETPEYIISTCPTYPTFFNLITVLLTHTNTPGAPHLEGDRLRVVALGVAGYRQASTGQ